MRWLEENMKAQAYKDDPMVVRVFPSNENLSIADLPIRNSTLHAADDALRKMRLRRCSVWKKTEWGHDATVCFVSSNTSHHAPAPAGSVHGVVGAHMEDVK